MSRDRVLARLLSRTYAVAALLTAAMLGASALLLPLSGNAMYTPLLLATTVSVWYGGLGPGLLSVVVGWPAAAFFLARPRVAFEIAPASEVVRWLVPFAATLVILWAGAALRRQGRRAGERAATAERSTGSAEALRRLASALSSAVTPSDVAKALVERMPALLGAKGAALGLVEGDELRIVDPEGAPQQTLAPGLRLPLGTLAPIATAARSGAPAYAATRPELESAFPDGARLAGPEASGALAVPLVFGGRVIGAMGFPFTAPHAIRPETIELASLAADIGAQALARAGHYGEERAAREGLERIARLAPLFVAASLDEIASAVCREARETLGADVAQIWSGVDRTTFEVTWRDPPAELIPPGMTVAFGDLPGLRRALDRVETMFVADAQLELRGRALEHAVALGVHSSLRVPIAIGGTAQRILVLQWERVVPEPSPAVILLARRFADQAGLALEHAERRLAEAAAAESAMEARRLLGISTGLAAAATPIEVAHAVLDEAFEALRPRAGVVVRVEGPRAELEVIAARGLEDEEAASWNGLSLEAVGPLADAVRRGEAVAVHDRAELARRYPRAVRPGSGQASLCLPLTAGGRPLGAMWLSFGERRAFTDADRSFGLALARQAGQAVARASLLEAEHSARTRVERMASELAQLHVLSTRLTRSSTAAEVTELVSSHVVGVVGADTAGIYLLGEDGASLELVAAVGPGSGRIRERHRRVTLDAERPLARAVRDGMPLWLPPGRDAVSRADRLRPDPGAYELGIVPLVVEQRSIGALFALFSTKGSVDEERRRLVETLARQAAHPVEHVALLERERSARVAAERANERTRRLQVLTEALAGSATTTEVAAAVVREGLTAVAGDAAVLYELDEEARELRVLASAGYGAEAMSGWERVPVDRDAPVADVARSGTVLELGSVGEILERYPYLEETLGATGDQAALCVPLIVGERVVGVLYLAFRSERRSEAEDRALVDTISRQCAQAFERSSLFDRELVSRRRSERLQSLTAALSGSLTSAEVGEVFLDLARSAVGAQGAAIAMLDAGSGVLHIVGCRGYETQLLEGWLERPLDVDGPVVHVFRQLSPLYYGDRASLLRDYPALEPALAAAGHESFAFVPLAAGRNSLGVGILSWLRAFQLPSREQTFLETIASQCGQALDRARRYESERTIAETLQRSVLPESLPSMEGVQVSARYLPGAAAVDVGGDWYDTIPLPDGRLGFAVGDVVGKGVKAAATMAQLRNGMRALALDSPQPGPTVTRLNRLLDGYTEAPFATLAYITLDPRDRTASLVSAGHLPPLAVSPAGEVTLLEGGRGLPLGVDSATVYEQWSTELEPGSMLVLYTDGLVERRDRSLEEGLEQLTRSAGRAPREPEGFATAVLTDLLGDRTLGDDVALLVVRLDPSRLEPLDLRVPADQSSLPLVRDALGAWLERASVPGADARDIVLATWEAGANAIEHAVEPVRDSIALRATLSGDRLRLEVTDSGRWKEPEPRADRGLGIRLMQSLMSSFEIERGRGGTRVVMERALSRERAGGHAVEPDTDNG